MAMQARQDVGVFQGAEFCQATVSPGSVTNNSGGSVVINPTTSAGATSGCAVGDIIGGISIPTATIGALLVSVTVTGPGQLTVVWRNDSGGTINVTSSTWTFLIQRFVPYGD